MNDSIDRQMAIKVVRRAQSKGQAHRMLLQLPSVQSIRWIPCSEIVDIPKHEVLCCDRRGEELVGWLLYIGNQWVCESNEEIMYNPVAYMPLPEPYREEGKQE